MDRVGGLVLGGVALAALAGGCTRLLDMETVRNSVAEGVGEHLGLEIGSVECPEQREIRADDVFECRVTTAGGASLGVRVTQADAQGAVEWETTGEAEGLLDLEKLAADIRAGILAQTGIRAIVSCGNGFGDTPPGESFACTSRSDDGDESTIQVRVRDRAGNVDWSLSEDAPAPAEPPA